MNQRKQSRVDLRAVDSIPLSRLIASLTTTQVWAVVTAAAVAIGAMFTLGYKVGEIASGREITRKERDFAKLQQQSDAAAADAASAKRELSAMTDQNLFLSLCLRFEKTAPNDPRHVDAQHAIEDWIRSKDADGQIDYRKGEVDRAMITFPDQTSFALPVGPGFNCANLLRSVGSQRGTPPKGTRRIVVVTH